MRLLPIIAVPALIYGACEVGELAGYLPGAMESALVGGLASGGMFIAALLVLWRILFKVSH